MVTPAIDNEFLDTLSTLANVTVESPALVNDTVLPEVAIPTKLKSVEVTVLIPPDAAVMLTNPTLAITDCLTSALNVPAAPTVANTDLTCSDPYAVVATEILVLSTPLNMNSSPSLNLPLTL